MTDNISRQLITYAFVAKEFSRTSDFFSGLVPLFDPIFIELEGTLFSPADFSNKAKYLYGLKIPPQASKELIPRFVEAGYLESQTKNGDAYLCRYPEHRRIADKEKGDLAEKLEEILTAFERFAAKLETIDNITFSRMELEEELLNHLASINFIKKEQNGTECPLGSTPSKNKRLDYLCARFIDDLATTNHALFEGVADIASGALISEMIYDLTAPSTKEKIKPGLVVYLDSPFIMALLKTNGTQEYENASELLTLLKDAKAIPTVLDFTTDEIHKIIRAVIHQAEIDKTQIHGPTGREIRAKRISIEKLALLNASLEEAITSKEIHISRYNEATDKTGKSIFPDELISDLKGSIGHYEHGDALTHDAMAVAVTMRRRYGKPKTKDIFSAGYIFLTGNTRLDRNVLSFCREKGLLRAHHIGPTVTSERMAAYLWLALGGKAKELPRKQLIVNCANMIIPRKELLKSIHDVIADMDPEKTDSIQAMFSQPRSCQLAMDLTLGDASLLTNDNIEEVFSKLREEVAFEKVQVINELASELESTSDHADKLEHSILNRWLSEARKRNLFIWRIIKISLFVFILFANYLVYYSSSLVVNSMMFALGITLVSAITFFAAWSKAVDWSKRVASFRIESWLHKKMRHTAEEEGNQYLLSKYTINIKDSSFSSKTST